MKENQMSMLPDIVRTIIIEAPIDKVWKAVSSSEGLAAWLMQNTFQPIIGYEFTFKAQPMGNWDGTVSCKVMELDPPKRLGFTWCGNNMEQYVSFELTELEKDKTSFTLVHSGWSEQYSALRDKMYEGWGYLTEGLRKKLGDKNGGYLS